MKKPRPPSPGWLVCHSMAATIAAVAMVLPPFQWINVVCFVLCIWNIYYAMAEYCKIEDALDL